MNVENANLNIGGYSTPYSLRPKLLLQCMMYFHVKTMTGRDNLKQYKMKHIPKNNVILKTQDMCQNKTKS